MRFARFPRQMKFPAIAAFLAMFSVCYLPLRAAEDKKFEPAKFLRFVEEGKTGGRLETAIATYENA
jgi:hypothetical protein